MANPFVHIELQTKDLDRAKKFYAGMFGGKCRMSPMRNYILIKVKA